MTAPAKAAPAAAEITAVQATSAPTLPRVGEDMTAGGADGRLMRGKTISRGL